MEQTATYISIKNWAEDERPREKLLNKGPQALSDAELLAILINSGTKYRSALDLARDILARVENNLPSLGRLSVEELKRTKGIGEARGITIAAALELGRRREMKSNNSNRTSITQSSDAAELLIPLMRDLNHEVFYVLYLNQSNRLVKYEITSSGGLTGTVADIRIILKNALLYNSNQIIIAHNHPSGNLQPSRADKELTTKLKEAASFMDIKLLDHLIVAESSFLSLSDEGYM